MLVINFCDAKFVLMNLTFLSSIAFIYISSLDAIILIKFYTLILI